MGTGDILPVRLPGAQGKVHQGYPFPEFHSGTLGDPETHCKLDLRYLLRDVLTLWFAFTLQPHLNMLCLS